MCSTISSWDSRGLFFPFIDPFLLTMFSWFSHCMDLHETLSLSLLPMLKFVTPFRLMFFLVVSHCLEDEETYYTFLFECRG